MAEDQLSVVSGVQRMTCVKYDGDPPQSRVRAFLHRIGLPIAAAPYCCPAEIVVMGDGLPTQHFFPKRDGMAKADVLRLLDHSVA